MKHISLLAVLAATALTGLTGCLTASVPQVNFWPVEFVPVASEKADKPSFEAVRISQVVVRAPYNDKSIAVLRADGTVAFDPYNEYAALPASLFKGVAADAFRSSGRFDMVVGAVSSLKTDLSAEITVTRMALDCREEDRRQATVALEVRLVRKGDPVAILTGEAKCDAADGVYGVAFSRSAALALEQALGKLGK